MRDFTASVIFNVIKWANIIDNKELFSVSSHSHFKYLVLTPLRNSQLDFTAHTKPGNV